MHLLPPFEAPRDVLVEVDKAQHFLRIDSGEGEARHDGEVGPDDEEVAYLGDIHSQGAHT